MTTPQVCTSRNLSITGPELGIEPWAAPRVVADTTFTSTGDGAITGSGLTEQPGRLMINGTLSWTSDSPITSMMRLQVIRGYRTIIVSNPNLIQIWDAWNIGIGETADVPDSYNVVNSLCTLGLDVGTDNVALPLYGRIHQDYPVTASEQWIELPATTLISVHYRAYVWTPPPWSNNASANSPLHEAHSRKVRLRLWAFPTQDEEVSG